MRQLAVTIDVDPLWVYRGIHGVVAEPIAPDVDPIYTIALPRFFELLASPATPATLFVVGRDVGGAASALTSALALEHELASHSYSHDHSISKWSRERIAEDLDLSKHALEALGAAVRGFRAPGYNVSEELLTEVMERGWYDSSLLPAPGYFVARGAVLASYKLRGAKSHSRLGDPRQFGGPLHPYRTIPWHAWKPVPVGRLVELPMSVDPLTRIPLFGTSLSTLPRAFLAGALERLAKLDDAVIELHAIDFLDSTDHPALTVLSRHQPDLRVPYREKESRYRSALATLRRGAVVTTLGRMASRVASR
ncbi:MAG: polysaccharide deacetylase family protein [Deltaproteobacteria bacterium]|nr:polysaccharide deacetylase family protein [Deltaproteobacteria bacterium]